MPERDAKILLLILKKFADTIKDLLSPSLERSEFLSLISDFKDRFKKRKRVDDKGKSLDEGPSQERQEDPDLDFLDDLIIDANIDGIYVNLDD